MAKNDHINPWGPQSSLPNSDVTLPVFGYNYYWVDGEKKAVPGLSIQAYWEAKAKLHETFLIYRDTKQGFGFSSNFVDCINLGDKNKTIKSWEDFWRVASTDQEKIAYAYWRGLQPRHSSTVSKVLTDVLVRSLVVVEWTSQLPSTLVVPHPATHSVKVKNTSNLQVLDFSSGIPIINNSIAGALLKSSLAKHRPRLDDLCKHIKEKVDPRGYNPEFLADANRELDSLDKFINNPFGINDAEPREP